MTIRAALEISAWLSTLCRVASPPTATRPAAFASATASAEMSTTTTDTSASPDSPSVLITLRPFVP
jgi:hypothetical protein